MASSKKDQDYETLIRKIFEFKCETNLQEHRKKLKDDPTIELREKMRKKEAEWEAKLLEKDAELKRVNKEFNNFLIGHFQEQNKIFNNVRKQLIKAIPVAERDLRNLQREEQKLILLTEDKMRKFNLQQQLLVEELQKKLNDEEMTWVHEFIRDWDEQTENIVRMMQNGAEISPIDLNLSFGSWPETAIIEPVFSHKTEKTNEISTSHEELAPSKNKPLTTTIEMVKPKKSVRFSNIFEPEHQQQDTDEAEKKFFDEKLFDMSKTDELFNEKMEFNFDEDNSLLKKNMSVDLKDNFKSDFEFNFEQSIEETNDNGTDNFMFNFNSMDES
ncbi:hypothetical protein HUG17_5097 [Dermatophagoides farinae]|uniref:Uncharacterized protein n=2 Tax=Dermatophagoides farinae TaxID=6954 RepID=A0A9D4SHG7_DERFA|nr:hypothetical protein HUG17_5097 [Dermatophagoides farinae]